jgi:amidase
MHDTVNAFVDIFTLEGAADGPLSGLTFGSKDLFDVAGKTTGCGSPQWAQTHAAAGSHAPVVACLLDAGATLVGKTHTDELAYSLMGVNAHYGTPVNTADPRRVPGGSSSGSAAAVAAGLVDIGLGSDTGGSVRLPASFCGVWGLRSTFGALSLEGAMPFTNDFDTVGWFAQSGLLMEQVAAAFGLPQGPAPTRLVLPVDIWARAAPQTVAALGPVLAALQANLGPVTPVVLAPDGLTHWRETFRINQAAQVWAAHGDWVTATKPEFGPGIRERFEIASKITAAEQEVANADRAVINARIAEVIPPDTVLVLPSSPGPAPMRNASDAALNDFRMSAFEMLCVAGLAGLPQLSIPAGAVDGGPVGLSLVGAKDTDRALIALARAATQT